MSVITDQVWLAALLQGLTFVRWDRFAALEDRLRLFGWIDRADSYKDFVVIDAYPILRGASLVATSSAERSAQIAALLNQNHVNCERVESLGLTITNIVKEKP